MKINRPKSTENIRPFLLFLVMMTALSLVPMLSHGAVFWDDEMEEGASKFSPAYLASTLIPNGVMAYDTTVKFSGNGSIRLNFPPNCMPDPVGTVGGPAQCGGSITQTFPPTDELWERVYFRMSGTGPNPSASGVFQTSLRAFTKMFNGQSATISGFYSRFWWTMGCCGSKNLGQGQENVPSLGHATAMYSNFTFVDNRWYCIETHEKMNTPGLPDGISEAWVDGVKVAGRTDVMWRPTGIHTQWLSTNIIRQEGIGNLWFDRFAAGDTRMGCIGATSGSDTTPPASPQGLVMR